MKKLFILFIILSINNVFAQSDSIVFNKHMDELNAKLSVVEKKLDVAKSNNNRALRNNIKLSSDFDQYRIEADAKINDLQAIIASNTADIDGTAMDLSNKIIDTEKSTSQSITDLQSALWQNMIYWIIAVFLVSIFVVIVFVSLKKQLSELETRLTNILDNNKIQMEKVLTDAKKSMDRDLISTKRGLEKELNDARKLFGEDLINTRKALSEDILKTRAILSEDLQFSKKTLEENIKEIGRTQAKELKDTKLSLEKEDIKLSSKLAELHGILLKIKDKSEDS